MATVIGFNLPATVIDAPSGKGTIKPRPKDITPVAWDSWANWTKVGTWAEIDYRSIDSAVRKPLAIGTGSSGYANHSGSVAPVYSDLTVQSAESPTIDLSAYLVDGAPVANIALEWWQIADIEPDLAAGAAPKDDVQILMLDNAVGLGINWGKNPVISSGLIPRVEHTPSTLWVRKRLYLTNYAAGKSLFSIRFYLDPITTHAGTGEGWYIDRVRIYAE